MRAAQVIGVMGMLALSACDTALPGAQVAPQPAAPPAVEARAAPVLEISRKSAELRSYYRNVQTQQLINGLLRTDGGGIDTPYTDTMLLRNLEAVAFFDEDVGGPVVGQGGAQNLRRWQEPVRLRTYFGPRVPEAISAQDGPAIEAFAQRLARVSGHPISTTDGNDANFHVFVVNEDDRADAVRQIAALRPGTSEVILSYVRRMNRTIDCLVLVYDAQDRPDVIATSIAVIRSELPNLTRRSCIHEEITQGLGILNDSPAARPSIFNDDDEFALLTSHDEALIEMLYDPRLSPGMRFEQVRPVLLETAKTLASPPPAPSG